MEAGRGLLEVSSARGLMRRQDGSPGDGWAADPTLGCDLSFIQVLPSFTSPLFGETALSELKHHFPLCIRVVFLLTVLCRGEASSLETPLALEQPAAGPAKPHWDHWAAARDQGGSCGFWPFRWILLSHKASPCALGHPFSLLRPAPSAAIEEFTASRVFAIKPTILDRERLFFCPRDV